MTDETSDRHAPATKRGRFAQSKLLPVAIAASLALGLGGALAIWLSTDDAPAGPEPEVKSEVQNAVEAEARHAILDQALADADVSLINAGALEHKSVTALEKAVADCTDLADDTRSTTLIDCTDRITIAIGAVAVAAAEIAEPDAG